MRTILANPKSFPSARILRDFLSQRMEEKIILRAWQKVSDDVIVRYGVSGSKTDTNLNNSAFIKLVSHKERLSRLLVENSIRTIEFYTESIPERFPVLIRTTLNSSGGIGIIPIINEEEFVVNMRTGFWWCYYIPFSKEYRVHVLGGQVVKIFQKVSEEDAREIKIRNLSNGYHFSMKNHERGFEKLRGLVESLSFVGGSFYGLDVGFYDGNYYVIEINSAPGLNSNTGELYGEFIYRKLQEPE